jgi:hypothetical protein
MQELRFQYVGPGLPQIPEQLGLFPVRISGPVRVLSQHLGLGAGQRQEQQL